MKGRMLALLCLVTLLLTGCWNRREIESLGFAMLVGIDYLADAGNWEVTAHIAKPEQLGRRTEGGTAGAAQSVVSAKGGTFFAAMRGLAHELPPGQKVWLGHIQAILVGEETAGAGLMGLLDWMNRDGEMRRVVWFDVVRGTAKEFLQATAKQPTLVALGVTELHKSRGATSEAAAVRLHEFMARLDSSGAAVTGAIGLVEGPQGTPVYQMEGAAVIRNGRFAGYLDRRETRGMLWAGNRVRSGLILVPCGDETTSLEVIQARSLTRPIFRQGILVMQVFVEAEVNIGDKHCPGRAIDTVGTARLQTEASRQIRGEVLAALEKARELRADIFGFGTRIERYYPQAWAARNATWQERGFRELKVEVEADVLIRRVGVQRGTTKNRIKEE